MRWRILLVLLIARTALGFQFQTIASTAPFLRQQFGIAFADIGMLIGLYMLPGVVLALPGGLLVRRFGDKVLCCTGLALMAFGGFLTAASDSYGLLLAGRLISGTGGVFMTLAITKMTTDWFAGREIVAAMGALLTSWPLGVATGLLVFAPVSQAHGWPWAMSIAAGACLAGLALVAGLYRPPQEIARTLAPAAVSAFATLPREEALPVLVAGLIWGSINLGLIAFFSFVPPLLGEHGFSPAAGAFVTSIVLWVMIVSMPLGGYWLQRSGRTEAGIMLSCLFLALAMAGLPLAPAAALAFSIVLGVLIGPAPGAIMAMPGRVLRPENRAVGLGLFMMVYYVVLAIGPLAAGALRDVGGSAAPVLFGASAFLCIVPLTALFGALVRPAKDVSPHGAP
jgi:predicted MFS family arabinose efflux permease